MRSYRTVTKMSRKFEFLSLLIDGYIRTYTRTLIFKDVIIKFGKFLIPFFIFLVEKYDIIILKKLKNKSRQDSF